MYVPRALRPVLERALASFPCVLVTGPRQSGKTTFLRREVGEGFAYLTLDDPLERGFAASDPAGFLHRFQGRPVVVDEIQYAPGLLPYVKMAIDADPERVGRWLLTGSQQFQLMRHVTESLAGRVAILELLPFSHLEHAAADLEQAVWLGGYPVPALHPDRRDLWMGGYLRTYLERDLRQLQNVHDLHLFERFLELVAARHGQLFNRAALAREVGISQPTAKAWGDLLQASYVAYLLRPFHRNYGKRVVKRPKLYLLDPGLVCTLTRQPSGEAALAGPLGGPLLEGWVVAEAVKLFANLGRRPDLYFWRSHDGLEVDLLVGVAGRLLPVEVKLTATPTPRHTAPLD
ncbi:MAG: ATP-binding protein, partial [Nitrospirae bacterium]